MEDSGNLPASQSRVSITQEGTCRKPRLIRCITDTDTLPTPPVRRGLMRSAASFYSRWRSLFLPVELANREGVGPGRVRRGRAARRGAGDDAVTAVARRAED